MARASVTGYDPEYREDGQFEIRYKVHTTGNRWFIPYNTPGSGVACSTANQLAQCDKVVGDTNDNSEAGFEST